jgi:hypothetical protein
MRILPAVDRIESDCAFGRAPGRRPFIEFYLDFYGQMAVDRFTLELDGAARDLEVSEG